MNWEKDEVIKLIEEYRKQRCLWDVQVPQYKDKQKKCDAWRVIGSVMNREWVEVERKMKSLIGQFQREVKKIKGQSGQGADDEEDDGDNPGQSKWFAFESMLFLKDKSKPHTTVELGIQSQKRVSCDSEDEGSSSSQSGSICAPSLPPRKEFKSPQKKPRKRPRNEYENTKTEKWAEEAYEVMKTLAANKDDSHFYGEYVASKLRLLPPPSRNRVQHKINDILFAAVDEAYHVPSFSEEHQELQSTLYSTASQPSTCSQLSPEHHDFDVIQDIEVISTSPHYT